jgi:hypothetical protein
MSIKFHIMNTVFVQKLKKLHIYTKPFNKNYIRIKKNRYTDNLYGSPSYIFSTKIGERSHSILISYKEWTLPVISSHGSKPWIGSHPNKLSIQAILQYTSNGKWWAARHDTALKGLVSHNIASCKNYKPSVYHQKAKVKLFN